MAITKTLKLDEIDRKIISLLQESPDMTHEEIATKINRSQPTVGLRLKKLMKKNVFHIQPGLNMKNVDLIVGIAKIRTMQPEIVLEVAKVCPYMVNAFKVSGDHNICLILVAPNLRYFEEIINKHFRSQYNRVQMEVIIEMAKDFILPVNFSELAKHDPLNPDECVGECQYCQEQISEITNRS
ncbi:MAG: AsnC family transcriptional regulator [Promethearchaeota archaeon]|nr:MAG: AsnC family transcriptional regulator [Candidatus Lokiarchaeota archaeon]